jgi:hypothetical protein
MVYMFFLPLYNQKSSPIHFFDDSKWWSRNLHSLTPGGRFTPARDGRHFVSSVASEAAQKLTSAALKQTIARHISADHNLSVMAAAAKRRREEMGWGTRCLGAGGATPGRWALRTRNVMRANEEGRRGKQWNGIANQWRLGDSIWHSAVILE